MPQGQRTLALAVDAIDALDALAADPDIGARLARLDVIRRPARPIRRDGEGVVTRRCSNGWRPGGRTRLYVHQAEAIDLLRAGRSVAVATGTASGKSLCYQAPDRRSVLAGGKDTALLLFPTKALAHDQLRSLRSWLVPGLRAVTYDGDTPADERASLRRTANVVLTNPEMLHTGILPYHDRWATFLMRLRYVVVDELHTLRGIFGSHVAHVLRRLRRVCRHYGAQPAFCFASATIGNPAALATELCGLPVDAVDDDGSPQGAPGGGPARPADGRPPPRAGGRRPPPRWAALLARFGRRSGLRTIAFSRSRRSAELVARHAQRRLENRIPSPRPAAVAAYRGGYLPEERRQLEHGPVQGRAARRRRHQRPGARHRRRPARRGRAPAASRARWRRSAAGRPGRPGPPAVGGDPRGRRRPARPLVPRPSAPSSSPGRWSRRW